MQRVKDAIEMKGERQGQRALADGIRKVATVVGATLGPAGRLVAIRKADNIEPHLTKDGVTVASHIRLPDHFENQGAQLIISVASECNEQVGDGTTTATILADSMVQKGLQLLEDGANAKQVLTGMERAVNYVREKLLESSQGVEEQDAIRSVALASCNYDERVADLISEAFQKIGDHGVMVLEDHVGAETDVEIVEGIHFDQGLLAWEFVNNPTFGECVLEDARVLVVEGQLRASKQSVENILGPCIQGGYPLVIIAEGFDHKFVVNCVVNAKEKGMQLALVKMPGFAENRKRFAEDIATYTGGQLVSKNSGLRVETILPPRELRQGADKARPDVYGKVASFKANRKQTFLMGGDGEPDDIQERITQIQNDLNESTTEFDREKLKQRLAWLAGGIARIRVGGETEVEAKELRDRVEDAMNAAKAATEEGVSVGGGVAMLAAAAQMDYDQLTDNEDQARGARIIRDACFRPIMQLAINAGQSPDVILNVVREHHEEGMDAHGFDAMTKTVRSLREYPQVLVPTKTEIVALKSAASVAGLVLTTAHVIVPLKHDGDDDDDK